MNPRTNVSKPKQFISALLVFTFLFLIHSSTSAQKATSSPYSRYGIGDLYGKGFSQGFAMGGANIALQNDSTYMFFINSGNPAAYSNMRLTTAELGVNFSKLQLQNSSSKHTVNDASVGYLALAFPIKKWWGASFGLIPYSSVGYSISETKKLSTIGDVTYSYNGSGGMNQFYFGNGIKPFYGLPKLFLNSKKYQLLKDAKKDSLINKILKRRKNLQALSLGLNASYMFGSIDHSQTTILPFNYTFNTRTGTSTRVGDVYFDYGAQYAYTIDSIKGRDLKDNVQLLFGATFASKTNINVKTDSLAYTFATRSDGYEQRKDTIINTEGTKGSINLPLSFGFGIGFKKGDRWLVSSDFEIKNWSTYTEFNKSQGLKNSLRVSLGAQFIPNSRANNKFNYFKRINYRIGLRYAQTAIELKNTQLTENAISFGLGLPVGRSFVMQNFSLVNIGIEIGNRGTIANGLIKEHFTRLLIGFTINDKWFVKPKYD